MSKSSQSRRGPLGRHEHSIRGVNRLVMVVALTVVGFCGCRGRGLLPPAGPLNAQQAQAVIHDPFPQGSLGPTDLGARPLGYQNPLPEPVRNRITVDSVRGVAR